MLNPTFSKEDQAKIISSYVAPIEIASCTLLGNEAFDTGGVEHRTQSVFGREIFLKLERAGFKSESLKSADVLEVCAGTGFLTYHLLNSFQPRSITVNDISPNELNLAKDFIGRSFPEANINWSLGDMYEIDFGRKFDVIIGNSFIHHFHDVPRLLSRFLEILKPGGCFISLHEPTPMSTVVEGAKIMAWPLAVIAPGFVNDIARARYSGQPSTTDIWMFEAEKIKKVALQAGYTKATTIPWGLVRAITVQLYGMHLSENKPALSDDEARRLKWAISIDSILNRILPQRCFGSICLVCQR